MGSQVQDRRLSPAELAPLCPVPFREGHCPRARPVSLGPDSGWVGFTIRATVE